MLIIILPHILFTHNLKNIQYTNKIVFILHKSIIIVVLIIDNILLYY